MKQLFFYILISLLPAFAYAQYTTGNKPQSAGDRIESTSYNDHKRGAAVPCNIARTVKIL